MKYLLSVITSATYLLLCLADHSIGSATGNNTEQRIIKDGCGLACRHAKKNQTRGNKERSRRMADAAYSGEDGDETDRRYTNRNYGGYRDRQWGNPRSYAYAATGRGRGSGFGYGEGFVSGRGIALGEGIGYGDRNGAAAGIGIARGVYVKDGTGYGEGYGYVYGDGSGRTFSSRGGFFDSGYGRRRGASSGGTYRQRGYAARRRNPYYGTEDDTGIMYDGNNDRRSGTTYGRGIYAEEGAVRGRGTGVSSVDDFSSDGRRDRYDPRYGEESGSKSGKDATLGEGYDSRRGSGTAYARGISVKQGTITGRGIGIASVDGISSDSSNGDEKVKTIDEGSSGANNNNEDSRHGDESGLHASKAVVNNRRNRYDPRYGKESGFKSGKDAALGEGYDRRSGYGTAYGRGISVNEGSIRGRGIGIAAVDGISSGSSNEEEETMDKGNPSATDNINDGTRKDSHYGEESGTKSGKDIVLGEAHDSRRGYGTAYSRGISVKQGTITGRGIAFANVDGIGY